MILNLFKENKQFMVSLLFIVNNRYMIKLYMYYNKSKISLTFLCLTNTNFSKPFQYYM